MEKPKIFIQFSKKSDFCETSSSKPVSSFVPHQAMSLAEMVARFDRGQRLNVKQNFAPETQFTRDCIYEEDFEDAAPDDIHDVVDVQNAMAEHEQRKQNFKEKHKRKPESLPKEEKPIEPGQQSDVTPPEELPKE